MRRFYYNNVLATIDTFQALVRVQMTYWYTSRRLCFYGYTLIQDFLFNFTMQMKFQECYKNLFNCIWSLDAWNTQWSKYIDACSDSTSTVISMVKWNYDSSGSDRYFIGNGIDSSACTPGLLWTTKPFGSYLGDV